MINLEILGIPTLVWLFPIIVGVATAMLYSKKNVNTGKNDLPINWRIVALFTGGAFALMFLIGWLSNL